jgi:hypothetical protein
MLFISPMKKNAVQIFGDLGTAIPAILRPARRASAASPTRAATMVKGGSSLTAMPVKKKEPPQMTERAVSMAQSRPSMVFDVVMSCLHLRLRLFCRYGKNSIQWSWRRAGHGCRLLS